MAHALGARVISIAFIPHSRTKILILFGVVFLEFLVVDSSQVSDVPISGLIVLAGVRVAVSRNGCGENPKKPGSPHNVRLYSIASTRYGDSFDGKTASLCVRRAVYYEPETGKEDPSKNGICSNFLCNSKPGDKIQLTGPSGKIMLLPEDDPNGTHIMIATGTGVAPFRGYLRRMFMEAVPTYKFGGLAWLFLGVANTDSLLYDDEFSSYLKDYPDNFRYDKALSREQKNKNGGKMYVQDKIEEYSDEIFKLLDGGAHIYFCGLKGMMPGIQDTLKRVAEQRGESWDAKLSQLKKNKQWHVEVY
ncbi:hypothetical protein B296_00007286 [Ensete ventricosum]|uniref:ferredoxin--NADP(+) reductase n=1 Tax=Ensete ventricosum TaxID=4639 RepID=A0A427B8M0_ENSVE|nr:hypothetical protein B296_00007286 [Ensete ventricosum]